MLFNSYAFIFIFLPVCLLGYFFCNARLSSFWGKVFLFLMSVCFCAWMNVIYALILGLSIVVNYGVQRLMIKLRVNGKNTLVLFITALIFNIGMLLYFKYTNFFIGCINDVFSKDLSLLNLFLPLGISFYTFSQIAFIYDVYKDRCNEYSFLDYALYVSYFPKLIEGPITLHGDLIEQFDAPDRGKVNFENISTGAYRFSLGLSKKLLLADTFSNIAQGGYSAYSYINGFSALVTVLAYSLEIYFDFSGYCDMAIGVSRMFNIDLIENFDSPYKADSVTSFWDRWHISLTKFFTRYLYIPLGGNRKGRLRTYVNVLVVFLVSGFWHGANYTFIIWGLCYGLLMIMERFLRESNIEIKLPKFIKVFGTFIVVTVLWSLFGADNLEVFKKLWFAVFSGNFLNGGICNSIILNIEKLAEYSVFNAIISPSLLGGFEGGFVIFMEVIGLLLVFFTRNAKERAEGFKPDLIHGLVFVGLIFYGILSLANVTSFIYSNF